MIAKKRITLLFLVTFLSMGIIYARLFQIQVVNHSYYMNRFDRVVKRERVVPSKRGKIFDKNGNPLALSIKKYVLFIDPYMVEDADLVEKCLAGYNISVSALEIKALKGKTRYKEIQTVNKKTKESLDALGLEGVSFTDIYERKYPEGSLASHILGIVGKNGIGLEGIEYKADSYLTGEKNIRS